MEPLPQGANFRRAKFLWEIGLHIAGNPETPYGGNRDVRIVVGSGGGIPWKPWLRMATGSAILAGQVAKQEIELAFVNPSALLTQAYRGVGIFAKPLPLRVVASYPSWDRFVMMVSPKAGVRSIEDIKEKRVPLRVSVREDPTHSTLVLIDQLFALHGFSLKDIEGWGGKIAVCGGPGDERRRLEPLKAGALDAIMDEGIVTWLPQALDAGFVPVDPTEAEFESMGKLGWRKVPLPRSAYPGLDRDRFAIDFSGWPIYTYAALPDQVAYDICGAIAAREAEVPWQMGDENDYTGLDQLGRDTDATPIDVPLHSGAERWYREHARRRP